MSKHEQIAPNKADIAAHLYALFSPEFVQPHPDAWIEIAYADPASGGDPDRARNFSAFDLEKAIEFAVAQNGAGFNVYVGAALRNGERPGGRSSGHHVLTSSHAWIEFDKPGDEARITALLKEKDLKPAKVVVTGTVPNLRAHLYFKLEGGVSPDQLRAANVALKTLFGTDAVQNPDRIMRLAGTINYPSPDKQGRGYVAEMVTLRLASDAPTYTTEQLTGVVPPRGPGHGESEESPAPTKENFFKNVNQLALVNPSRWVRALFGNNVKFYATTGCWRTQSNKDMPGRADLEEAIQISQRGVWDYGEEKASSPIDLAMAFAPRKPSMVPQQTTQLEAAEWLCWKMGIPKEALGWGTNEGRSADDPEYPEGYESQQPSNDVEPIDLWEHLSPPSLRRGMLPDIIERYAVSQGRATGADPSGIAASTLAVCAAAIPDTIQLQVKRHNTGWKESARIWVTIIGGPSVKKTPIIKAAVYPLERIDAELSKANSEARVAYNKLSAAEKRKTTPPTQTRAVLQSVTIEAAQEILKDTPAGLLCHHDELGGFFGSMDKYSGGKGSATDRAFWLQSYNGGVFTSDRVGRGSTFIPNLSACILGGVQPDVIRRIAGDCLDDGLLQRFLPIVVQDSVVGTDEPMSEDAFDYNKLIRALHNLSGDITLKFDNGAQEIRAKLEQKHKDHETCWSIHKKLATHIGKYDGIFARLCVVFHCVDHASIGGWQPLPTVITEDTARRVADFLQGFLFQHALAFYKDVLGVADDHDHLAAVAGYILAHGLEKLTSRDIARGDRTLRRLTRRDVDAVFDQLHAMGWISRDPGVRLGRPADVWIVNPRVHVEHAVRATAEAERRTKYQKMISDMRGRRAAA